MAYTTYPPNTTQHQSALSATELPSTHLEDPYAFAENGGCGDMAIAFDFQA